MEVPKPRARQSDGPSTHGSPGLCERLRTRGVRNNDDNDYDNCYHASHGSSDDGGPRKPWWFRGDKSHTAHVENPGNSGSVVRPYDDGRCRGFHID